MTMGRRSCFLLLLALNTAHGLVSSSWSSLKEQLLQGLEAPPPVLNFHEIGDKSDSLADKVVFYRDAKGWCPFSQRVWLGLEVKGIPYVTVLVDDEDEEDFPVPQVQWPDGTLQHDPKGLDILEEIERRYSDLSPSFYPQFVSAAVDIGRTNIVRFDGVFPRNTDPSRLAPFLLKNGELTPRVNHLVTLEEIDEVLEEYDDGPFLCGETLTAADIAWAPFLERYAAQLPLVYGDLKPRSRTFEAIKDWYDEMEKEIPCYVCQVQGDAETWKKNAVVAGVATEVDAEAKSFKFPPNKGYDAQKAWNKYVRDRPYLSTSPEKECAVQLIRKRDKLVNLVSESTRLDLEAIDEALREICVFLANESDDSEASRLSANARDVVGCLEQELKVPGEMSLLSFMTLRQLTAAAPKSRIA